MMQSFALFLKKTRMPYHERGKMNQIQWFLTIAEAQWLETNVSKFPNRELFKQFNIEFQCDMTYCRMRHFMAQYGIRHCEKGEKYTAYEREYVTAHYESDPDCWMGAALGRTAKSIAKLRKILKLRRSPESEKRLRFFRSQSGGFSLHRKIQAGERENPAQVLTDGFISGHLRRGTDLEASDIPDELIQLSRNKILTERQIKKIISNG